MSAADKIVDLRERSGLTQTGLADNVGINRSVLNRIENGIRPIRDDELRLFADYFNVSADYLLDREYHACLLSEPQRMILGVFDGLNKEGQSLMMAMLNSLRLSHPKKVGKSKGNIHNSNNANNYGNVGGNFAPMVRF